jgi:hypothetical protein
MSLSQFKIINNNICYLLSIVYSLTGLSINKNKKEGIKCLEIHSILNIKYTLF